ncbi:dienelactone hydrolase family protein [Paenibacillus solisilvae]|uniref:Dienelactone hydrolase family protein n=1 Tax=Paenibacillus solisilvae TaxID=2486751 RepID=A0ABW0W4J3_9BACL
MWKADDLLSRLYEEALQGHRAAGRSQSRESRKSDLTHALKAAIGHFEPNQHHVPIRLERVECDGYIRERVELSATPGLSFAAYVLIPAGGSSGLPGVLALHGHGYGSREIVGLLPDGSPDHGKPGIHQHFAVQLVKRGMVVIAPDVVGFGERRLDADLLKNPDTPSSCFRLSTQLMMLGKTLTGLRVAEAVRALEYLVSRPEVDAGRIGTMGFSGGGLISYAAAALDEQIKAVVLTGFTNTFKDSIFAVNHCIDNYTPGLLTHAELPELIGLIAPRPLFLESGKNDRIFPEEGFKQAAAKIQAIYELEGVPEKLQTDLFPGKHEISGRIAYDWLMRTLG